MPPMEPWLRHQIETKTGGFRTCHFRRCPRCNRWTLHGLDADRAAATVTVDPTPLNPAQEIDAVLTGRLTYTLTRNATGARKLDFRDPLAIGTPARNDVVPAHRCGHRYPDQPRPQQRADPNTPPF